MQALGMYTLALEHDPRSAAVRINRGDCHRAMEEARAGGGGVNDKMYHDDVFSTF